jgi:methylated-DNA-[protein]-cysteine S-methyltransferase
MKQFHGVTLKTEFGTLVLKCSGTEIRSLSLAEQDNADLISSEPACPLCTEAVKQLTEFFSGTRKDFKLPLTFSGTRLQSAVWDYLRTIPYGQAVSYSDVAAGIGCKSVRAVATAVGQNPLPIFIPCHRVIRKDQSIGKYGLGGTTVKKYLLELESKGSKAL